MTPALVARPVRVLLRHCAQLVLAGAALLLVPAQSSAQAVATATGPGSYIAVGGGMSAFQQDYGGRVANGGWVFAEMNPTWRYGFEAEARWLRPKAPDEVSETNYLVGIRVAVRPHALRPYAKFLVGDEHIVLPFRYATGDFLAYVPGAGVDYELGDRLTLRAADFEYQVIPAFTFGQLRPYGISAGLSLRLNGVDRLPRSAGRYRR